MSSRSLEYWRDYFKDVSSHLFDIIDGAIMVAAADYPEEFSLRRCNIAERLSPPPCLVVSEAVEKVEASNIKEIKIVNKNYDDDEDAERNVENHNIIGDDEAEALNDQIEHESQCLREVLRIRDILFNFREQSYSELHEALRKLQLMNLTLDLLQETEIGKAVNLLRKHHSKDISELATILIEDWKNDVDKRLKVDTPMADSENPPLDDEAGLPSPPLDEGALFLYSPVSMEPSKFFAGLDDDGNPVQRGEVTRNIKDTNIVQEITNKASNEAKVVAKENQIEPKNKNKMVVRLNNPVTAVNIEPEMMQKSVLKGAIQKKTQAGQSNKLKLDDDALEAKFEASKKKLQDHAKSAKRQRTAQYVEFNDLPKQPRRQRAAQYVGHYVELHDDLPKQAKRQRAAAQNVEFDDLPKQGPSCQIPPAKPKNRKRSGGAGRRFIQE